MNFILVFLFLVFSIEPSATSAPASNKRSAKTTFQKNRGTHERKKRSGVRESFQAALQLQQQGKFDEALKAFEQILRMYPGHQPSMVQAAKILYRMDRIPESQQLFSRINPIGLDIETAYEFALANFWMRQYEPALYAFKRVPDGHALSDLANYYGAIAALKLRRLVEAETMMEKAVVLPEKLAKSRVNYLKHIQDLKLLYEKKGLAEERNAERKRIEESMKKNEPEQGVSPVTPDSNEAYVHAGFMSVSTYPEVGYAYKQQTVDMHGYAEERATLQISYFEFKSGPLLPLPIKIGEEQAAFGLQLGVLAEEDRRKGVERRNIQTDELEDIQRIQNAPSESQTRFAQYSIEPWFEFPTPIHIWLGLGGKFVQTFADFEAGKRSGIRMGYFQLGSKEPKRSFVTRYQYAEITGTHNERLQSIHTGSFKWKFLPLTSLTINAKINHDFYVYKDPASSGPSSVTSAIADSIWALPFNFGIGFYGSVAYQKDFLFHDVPTYGDVTADGQTYTGRFYLQMAPLSWLSLEISEELQKTNWFVNPSGAQDIFEQSNPNYQETFSASAALNLLF